MDINDSKLNHLQDLPQFDKWYSTVRNGKQIPSNWRTDIQKQNETHTNIEQGTLFIIIHAQHKTAWNHVNYNIYTKRHLTKKGYLREQQKTLPLTESSNFQYLSQEAAVESDGGLGGLDRHDPYPPSPSHHGSGKKWSDKRNLVFDVVNFYLKVK